MKEKRESLFRHSPKIHFSLRIHVFLPSRFPFKIIKLSRGTELERDRVIVSPPTTAVAPSISAVMRNAWRRKGMKAGRAELKKLLPTWCRWGFVAYPKWCSIPSRKWQTAEACSLWVSKGNKGLLSVYRSPWPQPWLSTLWNSPVFCLGPLCPSQGYGVDQERSRSDPGTTVSPCPPCKKNLSSLQGMFG